MMESLLIVMARARPGQQAEMDDWYSNIHIRDAMRMRGGEAVQRFALDDEQPGTFHNPTNYTRLAMYESSDTVRFTREHFESVGTPRMDVALAYDNEVAFDYFFFPSCIIDSDPGTPITGDVVMQQFSVAEDKRAEFRRWYAREVLAEAAARPGVRAALLLEYKPIGQMLSAHPGIDFIAIYRLCDPAAKAGWRGADAPELSPLISSGSGGTSSWHPITPRLTRDLVHNPTSALLAEEEGARARLGNKIIDFKTTALLP